MKGKSKKPNVIIVAGKRFEVWVRCQETHIRLEGETKPAIWDGILRKENLRKAIQNHWMLNTHKSEQLKI